MSRLLPVLPLLIVSPLLALGCAHEDEPDVDQPAAVEADRAYVLKVLMDGYIGLEGVYKDERNPVLRAREGKVVSIVVVNGEDRIHDVGMRRHRVRSGLIREQGDRTRLTFIAKRDDVYYCTIPGHEVAGMRGEFRIEP